MENSLSLAKPQEALQVASTLQTFVTERKLTANIQGKNYPLVEAWQFAGSQLGLIPVMKHCYNLSTPEEIKYEAHVDVIRISDGFIMSRGFAVCSNKEHSKKRFDEYAIASMAQTRAVGKAYRNILAWLMKAAGFEATPAEEMDFIKDEVGDEKRDWLVELLESSTYEGQIKDKLYSRITGILTVEEYKKAERELLTKQK